VAGDAVPQTQELAQERLLRLAKQRHVRAVLAATQQSAQRDDQHLVQIVTDVVLPGINDRRKARDKLFHGTPPALNPMVGIQPVPAPQPNSSREKPYAIPLAYPTFVVAAQQSGG
jgi:hypothetical protein